MLPEPAGVIGQLMPPGAGGNLLRSTGYFDGAGAVEHLTVLLVWSGVGIALMLLGPRLTASAARHRPDAPAGVAA
jgi:hypothetical protein